MIHDVRKPGWLVRLWRVLRETSEVAVAIHYHAPWVATDAAQRDMRPRNRAAGRADRTHTDAVRPDIIWSEAA